MEAALLGHESVAEVAVVGVPDDDLGQRVVAYVVTEADERGDERALIAHVTDAISAHKRPREIRFVTSLPRNAMGKVRKRDLMTG